MFWFTGFVISVIAHTFWAGFRHKHLFYREPKRHEPQHEQVFESDLVWSYVFISLIISLTWPISIPLHAVFKLGKRLAK